MGHETSDAMMGDNPELGALVEPERQRMATRVPASKFPVEFCEALGLDPGRVVEISLHADLDDIVVVKATMAVSEPESRDALDVLKRYRMVEVDADGQ